MIAGLSSWFAIAPLHEIFFSTADRRLNSRISSEDFVVRSIGAALFD
jgi:hypothetical protein